MSDDVARAVGAGGKTITIAGKECQIRPLSILELGELERECLEQYQDKYLATFYRNQKYLKNGDTGGESAQDIMRNEIEKAAKWDVADLPTKFVYDPDKLFITPKLQSWLKNKIGYSRKDAKGVKLTEQELDIHLRRLTASLLDEGLLTEDDYERLTSKSPEKMQMGYSGWWVNGCFDGRITMLYICFKHLGLSKEEIARSVGKDKEALIQTASEIEHLSAPAAGNG